MPFKYEIVVASMLAAANLAAQAPTSAVTLAAGVDAATFVRYRTPGECWQAARRLQQHYWRDKRPDTVRYAPLTDSVPTPVIQAVGPCAARFHVATVPVAELRNLAQLNLALGRDSLARQAMSRLMQEERVQPARDRGWTLLLWIRALITVKPARFALAREYLDQLDALGAPAATWRLFAHQEVSRFALTMNDRATAEAEARAAILAGRQMSGEDRMDWVDQLRDAYLAAATPIALVRGGASALPLLDTMRTDLASLRPSGTRDHESLLTSFRDVRKPFQLLGTTGELPSVYASAWYSAPGDTIHPKPGHLTLITFCDGSDYPMFAVIRRLSATYGARGLDVVFLASTRGYFRSQPMPSPSVESDSLGHYFRTFLSLPVSVAMETTKFYHIADGRRRNEETTNLRTYGRVPGAMLIDRHGMIRWISDVRPRDEAVWDAVIRDAL